MPSSSFYHYFKHSFIKAVDAALTSNSAKYCFKIWMTYLLLRVSHKPSLATTIIDSKLEFNFKPLMLGFQVTPIFFATVSPIDQLIANPGIFSSGSHTL